MKELARELHTRHFSSIDPSDSLVTSELGRLVQDITSACQAHEQDIVSIKQLVKVFATVAVAACTLSHNCNV